MKQLCGVCASPDLAPLWSDSDGHRWWRCGACGSDTSSAGYDPTRYGAGYVADLLDGEAKYGTTPAENHAHNADLFPTGPPGRTFLDVGCGAGTTIEVMRARGWACVGWDVSAEGRPPGTVVGDAFRAARFARPFDAVLCREVLEHVPDPHGLLAQLAAATAPGGLLQLTTPRPVAHPEWRCYHWAHLAVWSPGALTAALAGEGFEVVESDLWEFGQRHTCRRAAP